MEKIYHCSEREIRQSRITFWVYAGSIPFVALLFFLPYLLGLQSGFTAFGLVYLLVILFLGYGAYRSYMTLLVVKEVKCTMSESTVSGVGSDEMIKNRMPFEIGRKEIVSISESKTSAGGFRPASVLIIQTEGRRIYLPELDCADELISEFGLKK